ncbi:uncharacterized protein LOC141902116 [Tubulanus polymorphus]|uniref:uncharacterized protein LOC141902116 n=1 Tax=Tubulanus polymorphus TaxID=672921 RepID=UPI003DA2A9C8
MPIPDRLKKVQLSRYCFKCLLGKHFCSSCRSPGCSMCHGSHHDLLHATKVRKPIKPTCGENGAPIEQPKTETENVQAGSSLVKALKQPKQVLMQTGIVTLESRSAIAEGRVLFDTGSSVNFISKSMSRKLGLRGVKAKGEFTLAGGGAMNVNTEKLAEKYPRTEECEVDVMLGVEACIDILLDEYRRGGQGTPVALSSHIGWVLFGSYVSQHKASSKNGSNSVMMCNSVKDDDEDLSRTVLKFWELDSLGILPEKEVSRKSPLDEEAEKQYFEKTNFHEGRYETGLLKHPDFINVKLKSNYNKAFHRLESLERRFKRDETLSFQYKAQIRELIDSGRAEEVVEDSEPDDRMVWYLPHHPVFKDSTTKRFVSFLMAQQRVLMEGH